MASWKPVTLKPLCLGPAIIFLLTCIGVLAYLTQRSAQHGGIVFSDAQEFSDGIRFLTLYLPTILAVLFGLFWSWIDLDVKRLEPFFQMSRPGGALAKDSVLLFYPFEYLAVVPIKALRRGHYTVFLSGLVTTIIFWGVTPLQSALFLTTTIDQATPAPGNIQGNLTLIQREAPSLNLSYLLQAYQITWLNQSLPPFMTHDAAFIPFAADSPSGSLASNTTLQGNTVMLSTNLQCTSAVVANRSFTLSESGCAVPFDALPESDNDLNFQYIGWESGVRGQGVQPLKAFNCSLAAQNLYLAALVASNASRAIGVFCQPTYWRQNVSLSVVASNLSYIEHTVSSPPSQLTAGDFNASVFQRSSWTGQVTGGFWDPDSSGDVIDKQGPLDVDQRFQSLNLSIKANLIPTFAIGLARPQVPPEAYLNRDVLISSLSRAHRLLFAAAMNGILSVRDSSSPEPLTVIRSTFAITVLRPLVLVVQGFLAVCVVCIAALLPLLVRKSSNLKKNPASISDLAALLPATRSSSTSLDTPSIVPTPASEPRFTLEIRRNPTAANQISYRSIDQSPSASGRSVPNKTYVRPFYIAPSYGIAFVSLLIVLLVALIVLKVYITRDTGLPLPSTNSVATQIIINYVPVVVSTLIEPYWTLLNRQLCLFQPLKELRTCQATAERSLDLRYSSLPPQLTIWQALRAKHYLLVTVSSIALMANVLSVGLGGLLNVGVAIPEQSVSLAAQIQPYINATAPTDNLQGFRDLFYVAHSILSAHTSPPAWTSNEAYFLPPSINPGSRLLRDLDVRTTGFGASLHCLETTVLNQSYTDNDLYFTTEVRGSQGDTVDCYLSFSVNIVMDQDSIQRAGVELLAPLLASKGDASAYERYTCASSLAVVYLRGDRNDDIPSRFQASSELHLICTPALEVSNYTVRVSSAGQILASQRHLTQGTDITASLAPGFNLADLYVNLNRLIAWVTEPLLESREDRPGEARYQNMGGTRTPLHSDAYAYSFFPFLLTKQLHSTDSVNASLPAPSAATMIPAVEELYRRLAALTFALAHDRFFPFPAATDAALPSTYRTTESRVLMSDAMFYLCASILLFDILAAAAYYWRAAPHRILPYAPTSLASMLGLFEGSSLASLQGRWQPGWRFGLGKFVGTDGMLRTGIERRPFVQPLPEKLQPSGLDPLVGMTSTARTTQSSQPRFNSASAAAGSNMAGSGASGVGSIRTVRSASGASHASSRSRRSGSVASSSVDVSPLSSTRASIRPGLSRSATNSSSASALPASLDSISANRGPRQLMSGGGAASTRGSIGSRYSLEGIETLVMGGAMANESSDDGRASSGSSRSSELRTS